MLLKTLVFPESAEAAALSEKYGYDEWLVGRFLRYVPDVGDFLEKMEMPPTRYIRANTLKISVGELKHRLESKGFVLKGTLAPDVFAIVSAPIKIGATTEYMLGYYYIQDLSSCLAVEALDVEPNQAVLDIAAAPGGKTTFISQRMDNTGLVVALEPSEIRTRSLTFNLARCGVSNACVLRLDGTLAENLGMKFERVLLDAPCSCEGVIAKDLSRKTTHTPADVEYCSDRQQKMIRSAAHLVKPGGLLIYSTCSFAPEENEIVVNMLLQESDNIEIEPLDWGSSGLTGFDYVEIDSRLKNARRLYPHIHDTTGFFIARLRIG
jgi:NOL1/NOP2/sun family putative RNA methylase